MVLAGLLCATAPTATPAEIGVFLSGATPGESWGTGWGGTLTITGASVSLDGAASLLLHGGGAEAQLSPGSISFTGGLELDAGTDVVIGGGKVDVT